MRGNHVVAVFLDRAERDNELARMRERRLCYWWQDVLIDADTINDLKACNGGES
jgi:hypothetical protein